MYVLCSELMPPYFDPVPTSGLCICIQTKNILNRKRHRVFEHLKGENLEKFAAFLKNA